MSAKVISNAKVTVLAAVLAAAGALLSTGGCNIFVAALVSVASLVALTFCANAKELRMFRAGSLVIVASLPLFFFLYAQARQHKPSQSDLSQYAGREVIFTAKICRSDNDGAPTTPHLDPARDSSMKALSAKKSGASGFERRIFAAPTTDDAPHRRLDVIIEPQELLFPKRCPLSGKALLRLNQRLPIEIREHDRDILLSMRAFIQTPHKSLNAWDYNRNKQLAARDVYCICYPGQASSQAVPPIQILTGGSTIQASSKSWVKDLDAFRYQYERTMDVARSSIVSAHRRCLPADHADLLSSMVLGNRAVTLPEVMTGKFRDLGLSHVLAASGFNLTIVTAMSFWFCRLVTASMFIANSVCFLAMLGFVSLAGPSPSVLRAALMCSFVLAARCSQRSLSVASALAAAFLITVAIDPQCTSDLGLQLSYGATVGIVFGACAFSRFIYCGESQWRRAVADVFAVVSIAQASVMPIQLYCFWKTGTLFLPANLLISPLITPVTVLGFAASLLSLLQCWHINSNVLTNIIALIDAFAFIPLAMMYSMVDFMASFQAAKLSLGQPSLLGIFIYYSALLALLFALRIEKHRFIAFVALLIGVCALLWRQPAPPLSVALVNNQVILIDHCGKALQISGQSKSDKLVERFLAFNAAQLDRSVFSTIAAASDWMLVDVHQRFRVLVLRKFSQGDMALTTNLCNQKVERTKILLVINFNQDSAGAFSDLVSSWKPECIIVFSPDRKHPWQWIHSLPGYKRASDLKEPQVKIVGSGPVDAIMLCREPHKTQLQ